MRAEQAGVGMERPWGLTAILAPRLDTDGSGYITAENLREVMGDDYDASRVEAMIREADILVRGEGGLEVRIAHRRSAVPPRVMVESVLMSS